MSLHPGITVILKERGKIHLHTQAKINHTTIQANKMKDNLDLFPRSTRFEFKLNPMEQAWEHVKFIMKQHYGFSTDIKKPLDITPMRFSVKFLAGTTLDICHK